MMPWLYVLFSTQSWTAVYLIIKTIFRSKSPEWSNRILTVLHGVILAWFGLQECMKFPDLFELSGDSSNAKQQNILLMSLGYFLFDCGWCLYYQTETKLMVAHHMYCCAAISRMMAKGIAGGQSVCSLGFLEVTNPLLQLRWFLRAEGYVNTTCFKGVELLFAFLFFIVRLLLGTYYVVAIIILYPNDLEIRIYTIIIYIISLFFVQEVANMLFKKYIFNKSPIAVK